MVLGQHRDDAVGLTQLLGAQHDALISIQTHPAILPSPEGMGSRGPGESAKIVS